MAAFDFGRAAAIIRNYLREMIDSPKRQSFSFLR